ncbi:MAG: hypothetical protein V3T14_02725 [Myxococcota bacterium]
MHRRLFLRSEPDGPRPPGLSEATPTLTFEDRLDLEIGGTRFELLATPGGETRDSMVVWL